MIPCPLPLCDEQQPKDPPSQFRLLSAQADIARLSIKIEYLRECDSLPQCQRASRSLSLILIIHMEEQAR